MGDDLRRTHSCVPRRDFLDASAGTDTSVDAARRVRAPLDSSIAAVMRLATLGQRYGLSLRPWTVKDLLR